MIYHRKKLQRLVKLNRIATGALFFRTQILEFGPQSELEHWSLKEVQANYLRHEAYDI